MVKPVAFFHVAMTSGLSGSPALVQWRSFGKRYTEKSSRTRRRNAVGGAHQVGIGYFASVRNVAAESNLPRASTAKMHAPACHGPKNIDQAALAQPVSVMHQWRSPGCTSSHCAVLRWPSP